uniref:uncharacterized protein LOC120336018 n=1 Tax=Styela clava TaxID=7725 RepID=UPI0019397A3F|nr:uncharacterized protein LOC120336018 [Styela clava]
MCEERGSELVTIKDSQMNEAIVRELDRVQTSSSKVGYKRYFIGLNDIKNEGKWVWSDGTRASYTNWRTDGGDEPSKGQNRNENCAIALEKKYDHTWADVSCSAKYLSICQKNVNNIIFYQDTELYFNHLTLRNYTQSKKACEERGSKLVTIKDSKINDVIIRGLNTEQASAEQRYLISLNDIENETEWVWSEGTKATYTNWYSVSGWIEPSNPINREEDCVIMLEKKYDRKWADVTCKLIFNERGNCKYHFNYLDKRTFYYAQTYCSKLDINATLAMIKTEEIHQYITEAIKTRFRLVNNMTFWVGAKKHSSDSWRFIDSTPFSVGGFEKWANNQPGSGNKVYLNTSVEESNTDLLWFSGTNDDKRGFICELPVIDPCHSTPCKNGGSCRSTIGCQMECSCDNGYSGTYCGHDKLSITATQSNNITLIGESVRITLEVVSELGEVEIKLYKTGNSNVLNKTSVGNGSVNFKIGPMRSASEGQEYTFKAVAGDVKRIVNVTIVVHEKANITDIIPSRIAIPSNQNQTITCYATGFPSPSVLWYFGEEVVRRNTISDVHQLNSSDKSILYFKSPGVEAKLHAGVYTCRVTNYVGEDQTKAGNNRMAKVIEMPEYSASSTNCSSGIEVRWIPGVEATHIKHKITLLGERDNKTIEVTPYDNQVNTTIFTNMTQQSLYTVKMSLCLETCIPNPGKGVKVKTGIDQAGVIHDIKLEEHVVDKTCKISWSNTNDSEYVTGFKVSAYSTLVKIGTKDLESKKYNDTFNIPLKSAQNYSFNTNPNRNYSVFIQAIACDKPGILSRAVGDCTSDTEAPSIVGAPKIFENGSDTKTRNIEIPAIDQSNGPVSCIFVIVGIYKQKQNKHSFINFTIEDLTKAEANSKLSKPHVGMKYIAIASSNIPLESIIVSLGDDVSTSCDIHSAAQNIKQKKREISQTVLTAKNFPLNAGKFYDYFVVTTTPGVNGKIHLGISAIQSFKVDAASTTWLIVIIILVVVVIIAGAIVLFVYYKRHQSSKNKTNASIAMSETATPADFESAYENVPKEAVEIEPKTIIHAKLLLTTYNKIKTSDSQEFKLQFEKLKKSMTLINETKEIASRPNMMQKNRYKNILPYDSTRVVLSGEGDKDYINASYIHGYETRNKFIASQGPLPNTVNDFWRMVIEQKCTVIVMLTGLLERGKKKCEKYWPDVNRTASYKSIFVKTVNEEHVGSNIKRTFEATSTDGPKQTITHFQFNTWPDHGVPVTTSGFFRLHKAVSEINCSTPIIVHCSAGAGRTGTYLAYDYLLNQIEKENAIDVYKCVHTLRKQRVDMVQNVDQYILVHKLLVEHYVFGDTDMDEEQLRQLMQSENADQLLLEFRNLSEIQPMNLKKDGEEEKYRKMNRNQNIIPYNRNKVVIVRMPEDKETSYINASIMESYEGGDKVIAAQGPMRSTVEYFWRAIMDTCVSVIVMLTQVMEGEQQQCFQYWPDKIGSKLQFGNIGVELIEETFENEIIVRRLIATRDKQSKPVMHYQHPNWRSERSPDISSVLNLVSIFQKFPRQQKLVHCSDGAGRTGVFCAIYNLCERFKVEKRIDVFQTVKDLRDCRPGMVQIEDDYKLCYDIMMAYVDSFNLYETINRRSQEVSGSAGNENLYENISAIRKAR